MKTYIGVKRIQAEPQERNGKPGYRVIYEPDGYESWSPNLVHRDVYIHIYLKTLYFMVQTGIYHINIQSKSRIESRIEKFPSRFTPGGGFFCAFNQTFSPQT